jgi:hypothetical protein
MVAPALLFAGISIEDMVVVAVLSVSRRVHGRPRARQIWIGQA